MAVDISSLPPDAAKFVTGIVSAGKYPTVDDVVVTALRLLESRERSLARLQESIDAGLADYEHGNTLDVSDEAHHRELFAALKARLTTQ